MPDRQDEVSAEFAIRVASTGDAEQLAVLGARTFEETYAHANTESDMRVHVSRVFSAAARMEELADLDRTTWLVETSTPVGYATVRRGSRADGVDFVAPVELERIYVLRAAQGRGAGALLMKACVETAREWGGDGLWLGVWEENPLAIGFYERMGFRIVGKKVFQLGSDSQTDFVMARSLALTSEV